MPEIENQIIEKSKRTISRSVAEGESATFDLSSLANAGIAKCVEQIYPLLYPQMIGLGGQISYISLVRVLSFL